MAAFSFNSSSRIFTRYWPWFFFAAAFESLFALITLLLIPSERGLSLARFGVLAILFTFLLAGVYFGFAARHDSSKFDSVARPSFILSAGFLFLISGLALFLLRYLDPERLLPYYERLNPLLWFLFILGIQTSIFLLLVKNGFQTQEISKRNAVHRSAFIAFLVLLSIFLFIALTKLGITPDKGYWAEPGVAMMGWQFVLSILGGFFIMLYTLRIKNSVGSPSVKIYIPLILYILAAALWLSVPMDVLKSSFYAPITPPANMPFPYSDAGYYDYLSQSLLIGTKYLGGIPPRPLYVLFLAFLHFLFGQNYPALIKAQTLVLALFPVTLYFLGKKLHGPAAGVVVALFAIFRELVGLWISSNTRVANSRIFTTDFPTAISLVILCLILIWWLERRDLKSALIAGGSFGLVLLFRTQSLLVLPPVIILAWFVYQRKTKEWIVAAMIFAAGMALTVLPWLVHNHALTGKFTFDDPRQVAIIYSQYSFTGNLDLSQFDPNKDSVANRLISFSVQNPAYVARFITTHILNTEIGGLLALPLMEKFTGLSAPVNLYWVSWNGTLEWYNLALVLIYLLIMAFGLASAWKKTGWIGMLPLAINLGYTLANGISRFSGWRYNMPVDWVIYFYFAIGAMEILGGLVLLFGAPIEKVFQEHKSLQTKSIVLGDFRPHFITIMLAFMFVGSLPWLAEGLTHSRYTASRNDLTASLESSGYKLNEINSFLSQSKAVLLEGRLLYPRMYRRNEGLASAHPWSAYAVKEYARIGFILINDQNYDAIFITRDLLNFPQGADAIILACQKEGYLEARVIDFGGKTFQSGPLSQSCN